MRVAYTNLIDSITATSMTALTTAAGYPIANVQDPRLTKVWTSDAATTQTVVIDLGSPQAISVLAIVGHNLASTVTCTANGNAIDVWTAPSVTQSITWNSGIMLAFTSPNTYQYWRFSFSGLTQAVSIGRLWIGAYTDIDPSSTNEFSVDLKNDDTVVYGKHRQKYASPGATWRKITLKFPPNRVTALTVIETMYREVGKNKSFIFCNFDGLRTYPLVDPLYGSFSEDLAFSHQRNQRFDFTLSIEEDL